MFEVFIDGVKVLSATLPDDEKVGIQANSTLDHMELEHEYVAVHLNDVPYDRPD